MSLLRRLLLRLFNVIRPGPAEGQLTREIASHLAMLADRFRARGMSPDDARVAARRSFGGIDQTKELQRDARSFVWLDDARRDAQYAIRTLLRAPGFTFVAVFTLALGIGAVAIIYSIINNVLFDPLPYPNSDRLVNVRINDLETGRLARNSFSHGEFLDYMEGSTAFEDVIGTAGTGMMYTDRERAEVLRAVWVTPNFFQFMGLSPLLGRTTTLEDGGPDAPPVAVLRHRAWVSYFGADPDIVGRIVILNGEPRTIVGVMPPRFTWHAADLWIPKALDRNAGESPTTFRNFQARIKSSVTMEQAEAQLNSIASRRAGERPDQYPRRFRVQVVNVIEATVGDFSTVLYLTLAAVALLLLIACCNVANMLLARATVREREMLVRAALGAGRGRIVRQLFVESLLLALSGAAAGCLLAYVGLDALIAVLPQGPLPGEIEIALDGAALAVTLGTAVICALLFGIAPALYAARRDLVDGLKGGGKGVAGGRGRLRNALVTAEIALSLILLLGAGLLMRTFVSLARVDLGFDPERILVVPVAFAPGAYTAPADKRRFYQQVLERIAALPGVEAASATTFIPPFSGPLNNRVDVPGKPMSEQSRAVVQLCTEDHFRVLGIRLVRGRGLSPLALGEPPRLAVVNQTFAAAYFRDEEPVGKQFSVTSPPAGDGQLEIAGVVEDVKNQGIKEAVAPHIYISGATSGRATPVIVVRTPGEPLELLNAIRREISAVDRQAAMRQPGSLAGVLRQGVYAQARFSLIVFSLFAVVGTLLVGVGVFSMMAYTVSRQTKEIAVRVALGAGRRQVLGVVLRLGLQLLAAGIVIGLLASLATGRLLANQLWNTSPHDPLTLLAATSLIAAVALSACYIPARRAMAVDPITALRQE